MAVQPQSTMPVIGTSAVRESTRTFLPPDCERMLKPSFLKYWQSEAVGHETRCGSFGNTSENTPMRAGSHFKAAVDKQLTSLCLNLEAFSHVSTLTTAPNAARYHKTANAAHRHIARAGTSRCALLQHNAATFWRYEKHRSYIWGHEHAFVWYYQSPASWRSTLYMPANKAAGV